MDKRELLEEAQEAIELAIENIEQVVRGTAEQGRAEAYILPHLQSWINGHEQITIESLLETYGRASGSEWTQEEVDELVSFLVSENLISVRQARAAVQKAKAAGLLEYYEPGSDELIGKLSKYLASD